MSVLWETGLGSCLIIIIGIGAAVTAIMPPKNKKPGAGTPGTATSCRPYLHLAKGTAAVRTAPEAYVESCRHERFSMHRL